MKTLFCSIHQWVIASKAAGSQPLPQWSHKHINQCASCRSVHAVHTQLERQITREFQRNMIDLPGELHERINSAVSRSIRKNQVTIAQPDRWTVTALPMIWARRAVAFGVVAVACLLAATYFRDVSPAVLPALSPADLTVTESVVRQGSELLDGGTLLQWGQKLDEPLQEELTRLVADAKSAVSLLANNFLPTE
jgi:hypothetical protein